MTSKISKQKAQKLKAELVKPTTLNPATDKSGYNNSAAAGATKETPAARAAKQRRYPSAADTARLPAAGKPGSYLAAETFLMEQQRRLDEQQGHRQFAKVNAKEHSEPLAASPEGELQNNIEQHPDFNSQRYDGIDPNENPIPPLNSAARREYDNAQREKQLRKELTLGNMPKMGTAPIPRNP